MSFILSTLSAPVEYTIYSSDLAGNQHPTVNRVIDKVVIDGYANMANRHFVTNKSVLTEVTDEQLELLKMNKVFQMHVNNGYLKIVETKTEDTSNMEEFDKSAPLTPDKYTKQAEVDAAAESDGFHRRKKAPRSRKN